MKNIAVLGSTGSIGTQTLEVCRLHPDKYRVTVLAANRNSAKLFEQVREFRPDSAVLATSVALKDIPDDLGFCSWLTGADGMRQAIADADTVLVAIVGIAGLASVLDALSMGKQVLLANKEALVTGGRLVTEKAAAVGKPILPVDSEHSAIFQCLQAAGRNHAEKILLTASGGPFRQWSRERIMNATPEEALRHPNWSMGAKITVDSASMFNKGLEIMEARWLFDMPEDRIQVLVHPQSIVHSAVVFEDGAVLAQLGVPDMRVPIGYAMSYPERCETGVAAPDLTEIGSLTFEKPDEHRFPSLRLAREALKAGGAACAVLNGANEEAVRAFLDGRIRFGGICGLVETALERLAGLSADSIEEVYGADKRARAVVREHIGL